MVKKAKLKILKKRQLLKKELLKNGKEQLKLRSNEVDSLNNKLKQCKKN